MFPTRRYYYAVFLCAYTIQLYQFHLSITQIYLFTVTLKVLFTPFALTVIFAFPAFLPFTTPFDVSSCGRTEYRIRKSNLFKDSRHTQQIARICGSTASFPQFVIKENSVFLIIFCKIIVFCIYVYIIF